MSIFSTQVPYLLLEYRNSVEQTSWKKYENMKNLYIIYVIGQNASLHVYVVHIQMMKHETKPGIR